MEWSDDNRYNPFNSYKGLLWNDSHYRPIRAWFKGEGPLSPPIEMSLDPCHACNFKCHHCNAQEYLNDGTHCFMSWPGLLNTIALSGLWGIKGMCLGGGGEPLMHHNIKEVIRTIKSSDTESAVATNGYLIDEEMANELMLCKWVAISVDAASRETFKKVHGVDGWDRVINNIKLLVKTKKETGSNVAIDYRFLITPDNWQEIENACFTALRIGVDAFHARPADLGREINYDMNSILLAFEQCHKRERERFKVHTTTHKFGPIFEVIHPFKKCVASPLVLQACADGNAYVCPDHRLEDRFRMCKTMDIREYWGSDAHRELLRGIDVDKECSRCTWGEYARQIETLGSDPMHRNFP